MKLSEKILTVASWLEDSENDLMVNAEMDEKCLIAVADALVKAASALKAAASVVVEVEPSILTPERLDEMAAIAAEFDASGDELLMKQASVLDELLLTIAAPRGSNIQFRDTQDDRIEQLKKKYNGPKTELDEINKVSDSIKDIEKSPYYKTYRPLEAPLSSRYCPDHPGGLIVRVGEHTWQCVMDKKIYNYDMGFKLLDGSSVAGGGVQNQIPLHPQQGHEIFDTRNSRLGIGDDNHK